MPRKTLTCALVTAVLGLYWLYTSWSDHKPWSLSLDTTTIDWYARREEVKDAFVNSWEAYEKHAWGYDRFHPVSRTGSQMSPKGIGWIIVDSLDTLMIMNLTTQLAGARRWISAELDYEQEQRCQYLRDDDQNAWRLAIRALPYDSPP